MSLKCSVFGHRFDDGYVDRERDEAGSEVVITSREMETCTRCGTVRVVSENKEVTTLETPDEEDAEVPDGDSGEETDSPDPLVPEAETGRPADGVGSESRPNPTAADAGGDVIDPESDDGVILSDEEDQQSDRQPGEWPDEPDDDDDTDWDPPAVDETSQSESPSTPESSSSGVTVPEGTFHCSECDYHTDVEESSLRAGDFCPECHTATLEHRVDTE